MQLSSSYHLFSSNFVNDDAANAAWLDHVHTSSRDLAVFLWDYLQKAKCAAMVMTPNPSSNDKPGGSDGVKRSDKKRKRHRRRNSSESSTSSSAKAHVKSDDSTILIEKSEFKIFGFDMFPDPKIVTKVVRCGVRGTHGSAYLSSLPLEEWIPSYVGLHLPAFGRKKLLKERKEKDNMACAMVQENIMAFWITHGLAGFVSLSAVVKNMVIMTRMNSEHGARRAVQYFRCLISHIKEVSVMEKVTNFDDFITKIVPAVETACNVIMTRTKGNNRDDTDKAAASKKGNASGKARWDGAQGPQAPTVPSTRAQNGKGTKVKGDPQATTPQRVCRFHHPKEGFVCNHGADCRYDHVDTTSPAGLKKYLLSKGQSGKGR